MVFARLTGAIAVALASNPCAAVSLRGQEIPAKKSLASLPLTLEEGHVPLFVKWEDYLGDDLSNLTFVQVGGNCGTNMRECAVGGDPVWEYATRFSWNGIVIEPVPRIFQKLRDNYSPFPSVKPVNCLVSDHTGVGKIVDQGETSQEADAADAKAIEVESYTLVDLWKQTFHAKMSTKKVDILVVDAEGNEPKILGGAFPEPRPKLVLFESAHLNPDQRTRIHNNLETNGYELVAELKHQDPVGQKMGPQDTLYKLAN